MKIYVKKHVRWNYQKIPTKLEKKKKKKKPLKTAKTLKKPAKNLQKPIKKTAKKFARNPEKAIAINVLFFHLNRNQNLQKVINLLLISTQK
jgi:hypothetical protein